MGGAVFLAGVAGAVLLVVVTLRSATGDLTHLTTPGSASVELETGDSRTVYVQTLVDGRGRARDASATDFDCRVMGPDGAAEVSGTSGSFTLTRGDDEYEAALKFSAAGSGPHRVTCRHRGGEDPIPLAIGPHVEVLGFVGGIFGIFVSFFGGLVIAGLIIALTALLRHRHRQRLQREAAGSPS